MLVLVSQIPATFFSQNSHFTAGATQSPPEHVHDVAVQLVPPEVTVLVCAQSTGHVVGAHAEYTQVTVSAIQAPDEQ